MYSGVFQFVNVRAEDVEPLIWIECPRLLFPFARADLADVTREGGYPPLMINPIDFTPLYWDELRDRQERGDVPLQRIRASRSADLQPQSAAGQAPPRTSACATASSSLIRGGSGAGRVARGT